MDAERIRFLYRTDQGRIDRATWRRGAGALLAVLIPFTLIWLALEPYTTHDLSKTPLLRARNGGGLRLCHFLRLRRDAHRRELHQSLGQALPRSQVLRRRSGSRASRRCSRCLPARRIFCSRASPKSCRAGMSGGSTRSLSPPSSGPFTNWVGAKAVPKLELSVGGRIFLTLKKRRRSASRVNPTCA